MEDPERKQDDLLGPLQYPVVNDMDQNWSSSEGDGKKWIDLAHILRSSTWISWLDFCCHVNTHFK